MPELGVFVHKKGQQLIIRKQIIYNVYIWQ